MFIGDKITNKHIKTIGFIVISLSLGLIAREITQYNNLPSIDDAIAQVADFFKYKENAGDNIYIWSMLLIIGIFIIIRAHKK